MQTDMDAHPLATSAQEHDGYAVPGFDAVARLIARTLGVPLVSLVLGDGSAYWFIDGGDRPMHAPRPLHAIYREATRCQSTQVVPDTEQDARFRDAALHPMAAAPIRFFASEPVFTLTGRQIGALCAMDTRPRAGLTEDDRIALRDAAALVGDGVVLRGYLGRTDPVTQLPHRNAFFEDLREHLQPDMPRVRVIAIEVAPVQRFHAFVCAMGHAYADDLLRTVARRVQAWLPPGVRLYQVGTSRFAAVLPDGNLPFETDTLDRLVAALRQPFDCLAIPLTLQPGIGLLEVAAEELRGGDPLRLVMNAAHAAQHSLRGWAVYDRAQDERQRQEFFLVTELACALTERAELELHYQPRVALDDGRCVALEALVRWRHPTLGMISPDRFIGAAERAGLICSLTQWVLDHAMAQWAAWRRAGHAFALSINVSGTDLDGNLADRLQATASRHDVPLHALELEFTEGTLVEHTDSARLHLEAIRALGAGIAIDDFGTGYSNLSALRQMPATSLKIDQSIVRGMESNDRDAAIVRAVTALAHYMNVRVIAEGVENAHIYRSVMEMACDEAQGYHIAPPLTAEAVPQWLATRPPLPSRRG